MRDIISAESVIALTKRYEIKQDRVCLEDESFLLLTPRFITGPLSDHLFELFTSAGVTYQAALDCNRFSKIASALCDLHVIKVEPGQPPAEAPAAFGTFAYLIDPTDLQSGHSITVAIHRNQQTEELHFAFYEPQKSGGSLGRNLEETKLTDAQIASCLEFRFA